MGHTDADPLYAEVEAAAAFLALAERTRGAFDFLLEAFWDRRMAEARATASCGHGIYRQ